MSDSNDSEAVDARHAGSILILRLALGGFLFLWAIEKFIIPGKAIKLYKKFFMGAVDDITMTYVVGAVLTLMSVAFIIGAFKRWVYLYGFAIHAITVVFTWYRIVDPYGLVERGGLFRGKPEHLFLASVPVLAAFWLLYVMRDSDTKWCTSIGNTEG